MLEELRRWIKKCTIWRNPNDIVSTPSALSRRLTIDHVALNRVICGGDIEVTYSSLWNWTSDNQSCQSWAQCSWGENNETCNYCCKLSLSICGFMTCWAKKQKHEHFCKHELGYFTFCLQSVKVTLSTRFSKEWDKASTINVLGHQRTD